MIRITSSSRVARRAAGLLGAGVAALGLLLLTPSPALADDADITVDVTRPLSLRGPGDTASLIVVVGNSGPEDADVDLFIPIPLAAQGVEAIGMSPDCFIEGEIVCQLEELEAGDRTKIVTTFQAPESFARTVSQQSSVSVENFGGDELDGTDNVDRYVATLGKGQAAEAPAPTPSASPSPAPPARPAELSGTVVNRASNAPLAGAKVQLADAQGGRSQVTAGSSGTFVWRPANGALRAGAVTLTASLPGYQPAVAKVQVAPGGKVGNVKLALVQTPRKPNPSQTAAGSGSGAGQSDAAARNKATEKFDLVSGVLAGGIGLGVLVAIGGIAWMWHGLGPGSRRNVSDLLPAGHRRRLFGRNPRV
jgi:hypothetical protein